MGMILQDWSVGNRTAPELLSKVRQGGWKRNIGLIVIVDITFDWMRNIGASHYRHCLKENSLNRNIIIDRWRWYMVTIVALKNISTYANVNALPMQCNGWIYIRLIQKIVIIIANTFLAEISLKI